MTTKATAETALQAVPQGGAFNNIISFENAQRIAKSLCASQLVPKEYQGEANMPNVLIALEMAQRIGASPIAVMQNLYIVHGKPGWSSQFLIACVNTSGRYTPMSFEMSGEGDDYGCVAHAIDLATGERVTGPRVTIGMAKKEGWVSKNGSKWQTMPELMLRYRSGTFFARLYCPDIGLGMQTKDEIYDVEGVARRTTSEHLADVRAVINQADTRPATIDNEDTPNA